MSRIDSIGLFWQDVEKTKDGPVRSMPKIKSKWKPKPPSEWPNFKHAKKLAIDTETYDPNLKTEGAGYAVGKSHIVGISVAASRNDYVYLPMRHEVQSELNVDPEKALQWARDNITEPGLKIGANIQYDLGNLRAEGVHVRGPYLDVLHVEALIDENQLKYNLEDVAQKYLNEGKASNKLYKWLAKFYGGKITPDQRKNIYRAPPALVGPYAEGDAYQPFEIWKKQKKIVEREGLGDVLDIECRLIPMLLDMKFRGVKIDLSYTEKLRDQYYENEIKYKDKLRKLVGFNVDVYSSRSIEKVFKREGLDYPLTEKGNPSFTKEYLNNHPHKLCKLIVHIRELNKLRVTFIENALLGKQVNGRVHCDFRQLKGSVGGTESGRLSSAYPNLQQIPVRSDEGKKVRRCFIPDDGYNDWYRGDINQVEYRFLAHHAKGRGAKKMRKMYNKDKSTDFHVATTKLIKEMTRIELDRKPTKTINFGLTYGMSNYKLQNTLGLDRETAENLFEAYHEGVPFVRDTFDHYTNLAQREGVISTILGRRSRFEVYEKGRNGEMIHGYKKALYKWGPGQFQRAFTHKALNRKLQGGAADYMKTGMVLTYESGVYDRLGGPPSLTVHDELDGSCNRHEHKEELKEIKYIMENAIKLKVPMLVDFEIGENWGNAEEVDFDKL